MSNGFVLYIDGASKGNPGPSGIGVVIRKDNEIIRNISRYIGHATNNAAEYTALICGLLECRNLKADKITVRSDSQLLCRQINGDYKVKHPVIRELYVQSRQLISGFKDFSIQHVPREENRDADKLATLAVKETLRKVG